MFQKLVSHNDDLERLVEKGYAVGFDSNYLVIRDIPYLDENKHLQWGAIVTKLVFVDQDHVTQDDHQVFFAGSVPYNIDGTQIQNLGGGPTSLPLSDACVDVVVERSFSNKPKQDGKFKDFFEKIESYVAIISAPAIDMHDVTPYTFRVHKDVVSDSVFKIHDTLTSRAEITDLSAKFKDDVVAIIGLGGTGSYVLDCIVKTPVKEIRGFDRKPYRVHNVFRSAGKFDPEEFGKPKAEVYQNRYSNFRNNLFLQSKYIDLWSGDDLEGVTFAFVCVDNGPSRSDIFDLLISKKIPFIDVGMGLKRKNGGLNGMLRTTYYSVDKAQKMRDMDLCDLSSNPDDLYKTNIQTGELNCMNACMAVVKFKQLRGFYAEEDQYYNLLLEVCDLKVVGSFDEEDNENEAATCPVHS